MELPSHDEVRAVLAAHTAVEELRALLVRSTRMKRELAAQGALRAATPAELASLDVATGWVITEVHQTHVGEARHIEAPPCLEGSVRLHTHPGLRGTFAGFSRADVAAVEAQRCPLGVVGYTSLSPELASSLGLALGWHGLAAFGVVQAALRWDAARTGDPVLLHRAVVARVCFPGGRTLPVRRLDAGPARRALESAEHSVDHWVAEAADRANDLVSKWFPGVVPGHPVPEDEDSDP